MTRILAIGNSFSEDATTYLHDIAQCGHIETTVVNLYIGGCSLYKHWQNATGDRADYQYQLNGSATDRMVSIREALQEGDWDVITLQQASHDSGLEETYDPYLEQLSGYVRQYAPGAKQIIHQTWAYETDSTHPAFEKYGKSQKQMYEALRAAYQKAAERIGVALIPCGDVIQALRGHREFDYPHGGQSLCRDGFHMHLIYGRYATAATWFESILKGDITENPFLPPSPDSPVNARLIQVIAQTVHAICSGEK